MKKRSFRWVMLVAAVVLTTAGFGASAAGQEESAAQAGEKFGIEGQFVRVAENAEGWVVLSYRAANGSVNQEWMLLDVGITLQRGVKGQTLTREDVYLVTPDRKKIPLPTSKEFGEVRGKLAALDQRANVERDSINYFPAGVNQPCRIGFFSDPAEPMRALAYDSVEVSSNRACVGRLYIHVPGGIQLGLYNLDVKFAESTVRVPIQIMTKEQAKEFEQKWKESLKESKHKGH